MNFTVLPYFFYKTFPEGGKEEKSIINILKAISKEQEISV